MSRTRRRRLAGIDHARLPTPVITRPAADQMTDVVVIGSDPGALTAAIACRQAGCEVLVIEPGPRLGARAASGSGQLWLPAREGMDDDYASARDYFDRVVGDGDEASSAPRRHGFLTGTGPLANWLAELGIRLHADRVGDHYPLLPGGMTSQRVVVPQATETSVIGQLAQVVPDGAPADPYSRVDRLENAARAVGAAARGRRIAQGGAALVVGLLAACQRLQVNIWWDAPTLRLLTERGKDPAAGRVVGVEVRRAARPVRVLAGRGVIIAQGGFEGDAAARREFLPSPSRPAWTLGEPRSEGVRQLEWAAELGLELAGMGNAWWRPGIWYPGGPVWDAEQELAAPHGFVVDAGGHRFANEAGPGNDFCRALYRRVRELGPESVAWLVIDSEHRRRYRLGGLAPGRVPRGAEKAGLVVSARTLPELAWKIKVDAAGLQASADRFDQLAGCGVDDDFGRGASPADRARGDRANRPNPCLGAVRSAPFHAVRVVPADQGTKGGLLTDEHGSVLRVDGPMPGLWAIGSAAASVTGAADPAPGVGLAEAMVAGRAVASALAAVS